MAIEQYTNDYILANQEKFYESLARAREQFMKIEGVTGVGAGKKSINGVYSDDFSISVFVTEKKPSEELPEDQLIPPVFEGYKTDVVRTPRAFPHICDNAASYSTIQGGIQITSTRVPTNAAPGSTYMASIGTLGCIVKKRGDTSRTNVYFLSNRHVLYSSATAGDYVHHPNPDGTSLGPIQAINFEENVSYAPVDGLLHGQVADYYIDCATARLDIDSECCWSVCTKDTRSYSHTVTELALVAGPTADARNKIADVRNIIGDMSIIGQKAYKVGRTTGRTVGIVRYVDGTSHLEPPPGSPPGTPNRTCNNIVIIEFDPTPASNPGGVNCKGRRSFSEEGDSGSTVYDEQGTFDCLTLWRSGT